MKFLLIAQLLTAQFPTTPVQMDNYRIIHDPKVPSYVIHDVMEMAYAQILIPGDLRPEPFETPGPQILVPFEPITPAPFETPVVEPTMPRRPINERTAIRGNWLRKW